MVDSHQNQTLDDSLFPTWNETFAFPWLGAPPAQGEVAVFECWDKEYHLSLDLRLGPLSSPAHCSTLKDDFMGLVNVPLDAAFRAPVKGSMPLTSRPGKSDKVGGELSIELWFSDVPVVPCAVRSLPTPPYTTRYSPVGSRREFRT